MQGHNFLEKLQQCIEAEDELKKFGDIREKCFWIFDETGKVGLTIEKIGECVNKDWKSLYKVISISNEENIEYVYKRLKEGYINRKEFKKAMSGTIAKINARYDELKENAENTAKDLSEYYDKTFAKDASKLDGTEKYTCLMLSQPEIKKMVFDFLKS